MIENAYEYIESWRHTPTLIEKSGGVWVLIAGHTKGKPNYKVGPLVRNHYNIHFILDGQLYFQQGSVEAVLTPGDMISMHKDEPVFYKSMTPDVPIRMFWISFDGPQALPLLQDIGLTAEAPFRRQVFHPGIYHTYQKIARSIAGKTEPYKLTGDFYEWIQLIHNQCKGPANIDGDWIPTGLDYMNLHFTEGITVSDIADYIGVTRSHFTKKFVERMKVSPGRYLQTLKMNKGRELLLGSTLTVTEIALSSGYPDLYSFTKAFSKHFGMPPTHYRSAQR